MRFVLVLEFRSLKKPERTEEDGVFLGCLDGDFCTNVPVWVRAAQKEVLRHGGAMFGQSNLAKRLEDMHSEGNHYIHHIQTTNQTLDHHHEQPGLGHVFLQCSTVKVYMINQKPPFAISRHVGF